MFTRKLWEISDILNSISIQVITRWNELKLLKFWNFYGDFLPEKHGFWSDILD